MFCKKCGAQIPDGMRFCTKCGADLGGAALNKAVSTPEGTAAQTQKDERAAGIPAADTAPVSGVQAAPVERTVSEAVTAEGTVSETVTGEGTVSDPSAVIPPVTTSSADVQPEVRKKSALPVIIGVLTALLLIAGIVLYFTVFSQSARDRREVREQLALAERYLDDLDYERAVAAYQAVLEIDPKNEEALEALEDTYIAWAESVEESDPAMARQIYEDAAVYFGLLDDRSGVETAAEALDRIEDRLDELARSRDREADGREVAEAAGSSDPLSSLAVQVYAANIDDVLGGAEVTLRGADGSEMTGTADGSGKVSFAELDEGSYTIIAEADGYNRMEKPVEVTGDTSCNVALAPVIVGDDACVLLTWDGAQDLDLCGFNADIQEYVNCGQITDSINSMILFADNGADKGFEFLYVHDLSYEVVKSIYVVEAAAARNGEPSAMESDGLRIYAYDKNGEAMEMTADPAQSAPLWHPFYIFAGGYYEEDEYITDMVGQSWISFEEDDQVTEHEEEQPPVVTLTAADRELLGRVANAFGHICLTDFSGNAHASKTFDRGKMLDLASAHMPEFVYSICWSERFSYQERAVALTNEQSINYGQGDYERDYNAAEIQQAVCALLDENVDLARSLQTEGLKEDAFSVFCVYNNGIVTTTSGLPEYFEFSERYEGEDIINNELIVTYSYHYPYGSDANIVLKVVPANNSLGYSVGAFAYQGVGELGD